MVLSDILDRLEGVQGRGGQYKACCPAHSDKKPSLSVSVGDDGKILLNCFAGCPTENIVAAMRLEMKDLFAEDRKNFPTYEPPKQKPTRTVEAEYLHNGGQTKKIKYRYADGTKSFTWLHLENGQWQPGRKNFKPELYKSHTELTSTVILVEGEKDVDTLKNAGLVAVSLPDGANSKWDDTYTEELSNEELVAAIQAGETERMSELWEQVNGLVKWKANRIMTALTLKGNLCGVELEDLIQSGYVAMVAAVNTYNPESGKFSTWLMYHLQKEFADITGYRTKQGWHDPLNLPYGVVAELDKPMTDDAKSDPLAEIIPDGYAEAQLKAVEERLYREQLHEALERAMAEIPANRAEILRQRYFEGKTLAEVGESKGTTTEYIRQMENCAIRDMRKPQSKRYLNEFADHNYFRGTGLGTFRHTGMSSEELYVIRKEERQERDIAEREARLQRLLDKVERGIEESRRTIYQVKQNTPTEPPTA